MVFSGVSFCKKSIDLSDLLSCEKSMVFVWCFVLQAVKREAHIHEDLGANSMEAVELRMKFEEAFGRSQERGILLVVHVLLKLCFFIHKSVWFKYFSEGGMVKCANQEQSH